MTTFFSLAVSGHISARALKPLIRSRNNTTTSSTVSSSNSIPPCNSNCNLYVGKYSLAGLSAPYKYTYKYTLEGSNSHSVYLFTDRDYIGACCYSEITDDASAPYGVTGTKQITCPSSISTYLANAKP
jgi:hypothetical protein